MRSGAGRGSMTAAPELWARSARARRQAAPSMAAAWRRRCIRARLSRQAEAGQSGRPDSVSGQVPLTGCRFQWKRQPQCHVAAPHPLGPRRLWRLAPPPRCGLRCAWARERPAARWKTPPHSFAEVRPEASPSARHLLDHLTKALAAGGRCGAEQRPRCPRPRWPSPKTAAAAPASPTEPSTHRPDTDQPLTIPATRHPEQAQLEAAVFLACCKIGSLSEHPLGIVQVRPEEDLLTLRLLDEPYAVRYWADRLLPRLTGVESSFPRDAVTGVAGLRYHRESCGFLGRALRAGR